LLAGAGALNGGVVLDLRDLQFIDAAGLSVLVDAHNRLVEDGGQGLSLTMRPGQVLRVLKLCALDRLFDVRVIGADGKAAAAR
jgi:anti-anti-sigma factor